MASEMPDFNDAIRREACRLQRSPLADSEPQGMGIVRFIGHTDRNSKEVLEKAKNILQLVNQSSCSDWPSLDEWGRLLPKWFIESCGSEKSEKEMLDWLSWWRGLSEDKKAEVERTQKWTLNDWTYWLQPENRLWFWWDATELTDHSFVVAVEAHEWPFPSGALQWLLRASGADNVDVEI